MIPIKASIKYRKTNAEILSNGIASFGKWPQEGVKNNDEMVPILPPEEDPLLCNESLGKINYDDSGGGTIPNSFYASPAGKYVMIAPRGQCTFEHKALSAQRLGASAIVIYGSLSALYSVNVTLADENPQDPLQYTIWPENKHDYDCDNSRAEVSLDSLAIPYDSSTNDALLSGTKSDGNLCAANNKFIKQCASQRCLMTGNISGESGNQIMEVCCAWDMYIWLYNDPDLSNAGVEVEAVFITIKQSAELLNTIRNIDDVKLVLYQRQVPEYHISSVVIWIMGTSVAILAGYLSASDYRNQSRAILERTSRRSDRVENRGNSRMAARDSSVLDESGSESLDISMGMALGFVVMSTATLLILFYLKIYGVVKAMYAFGCAGAIMQIVVIPLLEVLIKFSKTKGWWYEDFCKIPFDDASMNRIELLAFSVSYTWCGYWLYLAFTLRHPSQESTFFWVTQDIMGASICILFVYLIRVPKLSIASVLLWALFVYDIFFVFISPLIFDSSVMITVATSGGPPTADPSWCEKYPDSSGCTGGDPMPMLLTFPRIGDYRGGASMLGLGDIVLPGLLLSFACRVDEAKRLVGLIGGGRGANGPCGTGDGRLSCNSFYSYFVAVSIAYGIGLMLANIAVYVMNTGQPALLYLVPMTLGTMYFLGKRNHELGDLWNGPKVLNVADEICAQNNHGGESALLQRHHSSEPIAVIESFSSETSTRSVL